VIVANFAGLDDAIAAHRNDLNLAGCGAAVTIHGVAVVTRFRSLDTAVAAHRRD
jgi:hypothetical protein